LLHPLGDGVAMNRAQRHDLQDQHVERSLEEFHFFLSHKAHLEYLHIRLRRSNVKRLLTRISPIGGITMEFCADTKSLARGDRVRALSDFREAERLEPADYRPHLKLCSIYSALGDTSKGRQEYKWTKRLNDEHPDLAH